MSEQQPSIDRIVATREQAKRSTAAGEHVEDYAEALHTIQSWRWLFFLILVLSLLLHLGAFAAQRWGGVLNPVSQAPQETAAPGANMPDAQTTDSFSKMYYVIQLTLPVAEFLGQVACGLLIVSYLFATLLFLAGNLGGVRASISAFFWIVILLALLFPWGRWLGGSAATVQIPGVYFTFADLVSLETNVSGFSGQMFHYLRYMGYPILALVIALVGNRRFSQGYHQAESRLES